MNKHLIVGDILSQYPDAKLLNNGGQKVVYTVNDPQYGLSVVKIGLYSSKDSLERIRREVETLRAINSKWYPKQYKFEIIDNRFFILEERINAEPLTVCISKFGNISTATNFIIEVVEALMLLWKQNIIHRDLKPDNILVTPEGKPRIIDLGIARLLDLESLTMTYAFNGPCTPAYASPEQLENRKNEINYRSDQFSLGIVYTQLLLCGRHPFDPDIVGRGESIPYNIMKNMWAQKEFDSPEFSRVKPVVTKMLGHQPYERFRNPEQLRNTLKLIVED